MIETAQEFYRLRNSANPDDYSRAASEEAPLVVWHEVLGTMPDMKAWVALNKTVPVEILEVLARDSAVPVRFAVAMKRKLPERLQVVLAGDSDATVRERIAWNRKATRRVLEMLASDAVAQVRETALTRLRTQDHVA